MPDVEEMVINDWNDEAETSLVCHTCGLKIRADTWGDLVIRAIEHREQCVA